MDRCVPARVIRALRECPYESQEFDDLRALLLAHASFDALHGGERDSMTPTTSAAVAEALNDCSHMGPPFVALFHALVHAMRPDDVEGMRYTATRIVEARGAAPTRVALDADLDRIAANILEHMGSLG